MTERLPNTDETNWADILGANDGTGGFLRVAHNDDGTEKYGSRGIYGDGSDGDYTTSDGEVGPVEISDGFLSLMRDVYFDTFTVESGDSFKNKGYRLFARTSITIAGELLASVALSTNTLGGGALHGSGGDPGGDPNGEGGSDEDPSLGGDGGNGGDSGANVGGNGGDAERPGNVAGSLRWVPASLLGHVYGPSPVDPDIGYVILVVNGGAGGGGGASDGVNAGADGGDGAGVIMLAAPEIIVEATGAIRANGKDGDDAIAGDTGGGGGGGGGLILLTYNTLTNSGTIEAAGGAGGDGIGTGTAGTAGAAGTVITVANN